MKVGRDLPTWPPTPLPVEIIECIVRWVADFPDPLRRQCTLWSCCLISKPWYSVAVRQLYWSPELTTKNFDVFSRTLCPPVNAHVRSVGLETFVLHLRMGGLAYESTKSLTARLLRRTGPSLQTFVAPSVSFSLPSLAPLSKAEHLATLDLSGDFYDFDLSRLLRAVRGSTSLRKLCLPKGALSKASISMLKSARPWLWPPYLTQLQVNYLLPESPEAWYAFLTHLPATLRSLSFEDCKDYRDFDSLAALDTTAEQVHRLHVGSCRKAVVLEPETLYETFPSLCELSLPILACDCDESQEWTSMEQLEVLYLHHDSFHVRGLKDETWQDLEALVADNSRMKRVVMPFEVFAQDETMEHMTIKSISRSFEKRFGTPLPNDIGLFFETRDNVGHFMRADRFVQIFDNGF